MANLAKFIEEVLKRAKLDAADLQTINEALADTTLSDKVVDQADIDKVLGGLHNLDSARAILKPEIAKTVKAETLNGVDSSIKESFKAFLSDEEFTSVEAEETTNKKLKKITELINSKKPADASETARKIQSLTSALDEANATIRAKDQERETALAEAIAKHKSELFTKSLETLITSRTDIAKEKREGRHFLANFKSDYDEYMKQNGLKIDVDTGDVVKEDGTPYYNQRNEKVSLDSLLATVVEKYEYKKLSNTPERGEFVVEAAKNERVNPSIDLY